MEDLLLFSHSLFLVFSIFFAFLLCYWTLSPLCCCLWASLTVGFHGPPKGKAKKSHAFWRHAGSPKILAHLTSPRGNGGGPKRGQKKTHKKALTSFNKTWWKWGKTSGSRQIRERLRLHLLRRLRRREVDYHHYHLVLLLATHNNKQDRPCCTNQGLGWIRQTNKHTNTHFIWHLCFRLLAGGLIQSDSEVSVNS